MSSSRKQCIEAGTGHKPVHEVSKLINQSIIVLGYWLDDWDSMV
jgi:hypothetical protein